MSNQIITTLIDGGNIIGKVSGFTYSSVQAELETKATKDYVDAQDALKADKTYVDGQDALKADKTYVDGQDALKADKTYTDAQLSLKADKATTYLRTEIDAKDALKADKTYTDAQLAEKANKVQEAWITPTLLNGFTGDIQYRKNEFGRVEFKGSIVTTVNTTGIVFNLPVGYGVTGYNRFSSPDTLGANKVIEISGSYFYVLALNGTLRLNTFSYSVGV